MSGDVSVVIPTYNGSQFIREALESVFRQTLLPREIIVVDDASTDGTPDLVEKIAPESPVPVRLIRLNKNSGGPARPMNVGVEAASGEFIAVLDQDDLMTENKVEDSASMLRQHPEVGLVFGQFEGVELDGTHIQRERDIYAPFPAIACTIAGYEMLRLLFENGYRLGGAGSGTIRKAAWERVGRFDPTFVIAWDYDFAVRLSLWGYPFAYVPSTFYYHRLHDGNLGKADDGLRCRREGSRVLRAARKDPRLPRDLGPLAADLVGRKLLKLARRELSAGRWARGSYHYLVALSYPTNISAAIRRALRFSRIPADRAEPFSSD